MDAIVEQALKKWPNVPHCYGWLALDARGNWRMRDEEAQRQNLPGEKITHAALIGFINRNYAQDEQGCWYFQNGPQRVYVALEATPYIARTDPLRGFILHTNERLQLAAAWLSAQGRLFLQGYGKIALLDDRDLAACLPLLRAGGQVLADEQLLAWLASTEPREALALAWQGMELPLGFIEENAVSQYFRFISVPQPPH